MVLKQESIFTEEDLMQRLLQPLGLGMHQVTESCTDI